MRGRGFRFAPPPSVEPRPFGAPSRRHRPSASVRLRPRPAASRFPSDALSCWRRWPVARRLRQSTSAKSDGWKDSTIPFRSKPLSPMSWNRPEHGVRCERTSPAPTSILGRRTVMPSCGRSPSPFVASRSFPIVFPTISSPRRCACCWIRTPTSSRNDTTRPDDERKSGKGQHAFRD